MDTKKLIKINFKYFWEGFDPKNNFFTNLLKKRYKVVISNKPDYVFYSVFQVRGKSKDLSKKGDFIKKVSPFAYIFLRKLYAKIKSLKDYKKREAPKGDFIKIFYGAEHVKPKMNECDWAFSSYFEEEIKNSRHMRLPAYIVSDYQLKKFGVPSRKRKIDFKRIRKEKKRFCNFIYSQENLSRNDFFKKLSQYKKIDSPGRCMTNMHPISHGSSKESRSSSNWVLEKLKFLKKYKFTIGFENISKSGWVTEKLTHPFLVNSIPIYVGHEDVKKEFNTKSFINYHDFKNMKKFIEYIIKVDNDDSLYEKILKEPLHLNKKFSKEIGVEKILKRFEKIFG